MARSRDPDYLGPDFGRLGPRLGPRSLYKGQRTRRLAIWSETGFIPNLRDIKLPPGVEDCGPLGTNDEDPSLRLAWRGGWLKCQTLLILRNGKVNHSDIAASTNALMLVLVVLPYCNYAEHGSRWVFRLLACIVWLTWYCPMFYTICNID